MRCVLLCLFNPSPSHPSPLAFCTTSAPTCHCAKETSLTIAGEMMDPTEERAQRGHSMGDSSQGPNDPRTIPIIHPPILQTTAPSPGDPIELTPPSSAMMAPPARTSPDNDTNGLQERMGMGDQPSSGSIAGPSAAAAAAAGAQQPKVVQTAFIHKLYK